MYRNTRQIILFLFACALSCVGARAQSSVTIDPGAIIRNGNESYYNPVYWMTYSFPPVTFTSISDGTLIGDNTAGTFGTSFETHGASIGLSISWSLSVASNGQILLTYSWTAGIGSKQNKTVYTGKWANALNGYSSPSSPGSTGEGSSSGGYGGFQYQYETSGNSAQFDYYYQQQYSSPPTGSVTMGPTIFIGYME